MTRECKRCGYTRPLDEFYKSRGRVNPWCKSCYKEWYAARNGGVTDRSCDGGCGTVMSVTARRAAEPSVYCSRECKDRGRNAAVSAETLMAKPDRECLHCGQALPRAMRADAVFCSGRCNYAAHALQRSLRVRGGSDEKPGYLRAAICKRDGWRCGICAERVNPSLEYPHPRAASLDHVVPVSEGGLSDPANLRLVHLVCNLRRRNLGGGEQLALI